MQVSVVIITKNEATNIVDCIVSAKKISNDIIVIDSESTDATILLAKTEKAKVQSISWEGYGHSRNAGAMIAVNDWIFSLDADERITDKLVASMENIDFSGKDAIYGFKRLNYFGDKKISYRSFAHDRVFRLYNRNNYKWDIAPIHEKLTGENPVGVMIRGGVIHYAIRTASLYQQKISGYAALCALKYKQEKKGFVYVRSLLSPVFNFVQDYIFQLGFLDRYTGFIIAKINARHTKKKYQQLLVLLKEENNQNSRQLFLQHSIRKIVLFFS